MRTAVGWIHDNGGHPLRPKTHPKNFWNMLDVKIDQTSDAQYKKALEALREVPRNVIEQCFRNVDYLK